jgi:uncharacterized protein (TIGR03435 family)
MTLWNWAIVPAVLASSVAFGQDAAKPLSFEVASVKPASAPIATKDDYSAGYNAGMRAAMASQGIRVVGQRVTIIDNSLKDLIRLAYQVKEHQIIAPAWMSAEKYEITANMPAGTTRAQAPEMLQTLLADRFHLKFHRETRTMAVYAMVPTKGGPRLTAATPPANGRGASFAQSGRGRVITKSASLEKFADELSKGADRPIVDMTGLTGLFDIDFTYSSELSATSPEADPTMAAALAEQLGLKLERRDMKVEVLVIESADKVPTEN